MMRALFAGVTGLRTHQTRMDVLGNNISNVNTVGYKKSVSNFADLYSDTLSSAQAPTGTNGSVNAKQIGLGVGVNSITTKHNQGAPQYTGNPLDLAITGEGFFVLRTPAGNQFTRAGDFKIGTTGFLENQNGYFVQGFSSIYQQGTIGETTANGYDKLKATNFETTVTDANGNTKTQAFNFISDSTTTPAGNYRLQITPGANGADPELTVYKNGYPIEMPGTPSITFRDAGGNVVTDNDVPVGTNVEIVIPDVGTFTSTVTAQAGTTTVPRDSLMTQLASSISNQDLVVSNNDGFVSTPALGDIFIDQNLYENVSITTEGQVVAQLKESLDETKSPSGFPMAQGEKVIIGYISLATFPNTEGLEKSSSNMFVMTPGSGQATFNLVNQNGAGGITTSSLEMSNVDLSDEMVSVITTQRGFQANSRIITVSDTLLEELINLKR